MKIIITGWKEGLNKVELNKFMREEFGYNIREAKNIVNDILNGNEVTLVCDQEVLDRLKYFDLKFKLP